MAEENTTQSDNSQDSTNTQQPIFDKAELAKLVKENVGTSFKEALEEQSRQQEFNKTQEANTQKDSTQQGDFWDDIINPRVSAKTNAASLAAQAAEDKVDFYTGGDFDTVDDFLISDDPEERGKEKLEIRKKVEETFSNMLKAGKGTYRKDILSYVLGEKLKKDRVAYQESINKRSAKSKQAELEKARRGVDISTGILTNFTPEDIHKMPFEKVVEQFGDIHF